MKTLRFLSVLLLLCALPLCAFAMDEGYLHDSVKWNSNGETVFLYPEDFNGQQGEEGIYQYYTDLTDNCFYLHLSYTDSRLQDSGDNDIRLNFNIKNSSRTYQFSIDENGFIHSSEYTDREALSAFSVRGKFNDIWLNGQEIYIGIEFLNKNDKTLNNYLTFSLTVNNHTYYLCNSSIKLAYGDYADSLTTARQTTTKPSTAKESTTKATTTKPSTTKQTETKPSTDRETVTKQTTTKRETTTKFKYTYIPTTKTQTTEKEANITAEKTTKQKAESTTKFKYTGEATSIKSEGNDRETAADENTFSGGDIIEENTTAPNAQDGANQTENSVIIPETNSTAEKTPQAKLMTALAVIFAVAGGTLIARNALPKKKPANENDEEE